MQLLRSSWTARSRRARFGSSVLFRGSARPTATAYIRTGSFTRRISSCRTYRRSIFRCLLNSAPFAATAGRGSRRSRGSASPASSGAQPGRMCTAFGSSPSWQPID
jgi:hypothetical protein